MNKQTKLAGAERKAPVSRSASLLNSALAVSLLLIATLGCNLLKLNSDSNSNSNPTPSPTSTSSPSPNKSPFEKTRWAGQDSSHVANLTFGLHPEGEADFSMDVPGKPPMTSAGTWTASGNSVTMVFGPLTADVTITGNEMSGTMRGKESPPFAFTATKQ